MVAPAAGACRPRSLLPHGAAQHTVGGDLCLASCKLTRVNARSSPLLHRDSGGCRDHSNFKESFSA
eukprot:6187644-Pleurochrysis_carterae.AAC.1